MLQWLPVAGYQPLSAGLWENLRYMLMPAVTLGLAQAALLSRLTRSMMLVDATVAVPIDFIRLPLIAVIGAVFYGEAFDPMVIVGAVVIFAGTYYSLSRERR